ncbi:MAG TPA: hypothetical protein EYG92_00495 [Lutibacter sp.]|nr:hypothetical protein [Lutibacter sp.]
MNVKYFSFLSILFFFFINGNFKLSAQIQKDSITYYENKLLSINEVSIDKALYYFDQLCKRVSGKKKVKVLRKKAKYLAEYGSKKAFISTYEKALKLSKNNKYKLLEGVLYHDLGFYHYNYFNNNALAYKNFLLAKELYEEINNQKQLNIINTNIATFLADAGKYEEANTIFKETLAYYEKKKDTSNIVFVKINMGGLQREVKNYAKSKEIFNKLLQSNYLNQSDISLVYYNLAINSIKQKKYEEANAFINQSISISKDLQEDIQLIDLYFLKADVAKQTKKYKKAINYFTKSLVLAKEIEDYPFQKELLKNIISVSIKNKNFTGIDSLNNEINSINDSIKNREKRNTLNEIYLENALSKKEKEIRIHQSSIKKEKELTRLYVTIIILSSLFLLALVAYIISYKKNNHKRLQLLQNSIKIKEIENKTKRKFELQETKRIQEDLKAKKKELLLDLSLGAKRVEKVELVLRKMNELSKKSIIAQKDIVELKQFTQAKYEQLLISEKLRKDMMHVNKDFYNSLLVDFPSLSNTELKVISFLGVGLETKEIAIIQNVSVDAIRKTRYRIRKKIGLKPEESLEKFIIKYQ